MLCYCTDNNDNTANANDNVYMITDVLQFEFAVYTNVRANAVSIWYQLPQYVIITAGEVLFSLTSISFAYTQVIYEMLYFF